MPERSSLRIVLNLKMKTMKRFFTLFKKSVGHQKNDRYFFTKAGKFLPVVFVISFVLSSSSVLAQPSDPGNPTSNSPQCSNPGVTLTANGTPPVGETWYWQTSATGTSTANSGSTYVVTTSGTYYIRSLDSTTLL